MVAHAWLERGGRARNGGDRGAGVVARRGGERVVDGGGGDVRVCGGVSVSRGVADGEGADARRDAGDAGGGEGGREGFRADESLGRIWASLRRDRGAGTAGGAGAGGAVWIFAGNVVDPDWSDAGRSGARLRGDVLFGAARRKIAGADGAGRGGAVRGFCRAGEHHRDHGDPARGAGAGGGERAGGEPVGAVHDRGDDADRGGDGARDAVWRARRGVAGGGERAGRGGAARGGLRRAVRARVGLGRSADAEGHDAGVVDYWIRNPGVGAAGMAAARAAGLSEHVHEGGWRRCCRYGCCSRRGII
jgi:hypothetical protein